MLLQRITCLAMTAVLLLGGGSELLVIGLTGHGAHCTGTICYCPKRCAKDHGAGHPTTHVAPTGHHGMAGAQGTAADGAWCPGSRHCELREAAPLPPLDTVPAILAARVPDTAAAPISPAMIATGPRAPDTEPGITTPPPRV